MWNPYAKDEGHNGQMAEAIKRDIDCDTFVDLFFEGLARMQLKPQETQKEKPD